MATSFNWAGDAIVRDTIMWEKRVVIGSGSLFIPTDVRAWLASDKSEVILRALQEIDLPSARAAGTFDLRAWKIWEYVAKSVQYVTDKTTFGVDDLWLFPEETLTLQKGDCEDTSFLLGTLLLASGISEHCVRVVLGSVSTPDGEFGHAWTVYQNEAGTWCLMESTLDSIPTDLTPADPFIVPGSKCQYLPLFCLNGSHLWSLGSSGQQMTDYLKKRTRAWKGDSS